MNNIEVLKQTVEESKKSRISLDNTLNELTERLKELKEFDDVEKFLKVQNRIKFFELNEEKL